MTQPTGVVAIICEDIREEKSGQDTLVGVMPDNLRLTKFPAFIPKLATYIRIHFDPNIVVPPIQAKLSIPDGPELDVGAADSALIEKGRNEALQNEMPYAGIILKTVILGFKLTSAGLIKLSVNFGGEDQLCAAIRVTEVQRTNK